jgi:hypothetical protein
MPRNRKRKYLIPSKSKSTDSDSYGRRKKKTKAGGWDIFIERLCLDILTNCNGYVWMYERMIRKYKKWTERMNILSGLLGAVVATIGIITINSTITKYINVTNAIIGFLISCISVCTTVWKLNENLTNSANAFIAFKNLASTIKCQLAMPSEKRENSKRFVEIISADFATIQINLPLIDETIKAQYLLNFPNSTIYTPSNDNLVNLMDSEPSVDAIVQMESDV